MGPFVTLFGQISFLYDYDGFISQVAYSLKWSFVEGTKHDPIFTSRCSMSLLRNSAGMVAHACTIPL